MQSDNTQNGGWHFTDDETPVAVRSSGQSQAAPVSGNGPALDIAHANREPVSIAPQSNVNARGMTASAVLGVLIAVTGIGMYAGFGGLAGQLTGGSTDSVAITVTKEGEFSPSSAEIHPGQTVTITNENVDPQVLKSRNGRDLFPVQVIFDTPYTFTVASDATGPYIYYSETLPEDKTLTLTVTPAVQAATESSVSSSVSSSVEAFDIPLPFGDTPLQPTASSAPAVTVASSASTVATTSSDDRITISLGGASSSASSIETTAGSLPTNPYTVGSTTSAPVIDNLHSGAPLQQITQHQPRSVTSTGPEGFVFVLILSMFGVAFFFKRYCR